uniref:maltotransferase domain-containing protein n=1 Tax=Streptomyces sp. NRRL S-1314 TaxID=1463882 RepID=UPI0004C553B2
MPAKHQSSSPSSRSPRTPSGAPRGRPAATGRAPAAPAQSTPATPAAPAPPETSVGRIPVLDVRPLVRQGRRPAKAVVGESFEVTATVFREGHDAVAANVVLKDPEGRPGPFTQVVLEEGARLHERAAEQAPGPGDREVLRAAVDALRDTERPAPARLAAALTPEVDAVLARHPLRELVTSSEPLPLLVERERALYGSWYEFFPRSEGTPEQPHGT